jgi:FtsZ-binding cell division protein ZapB
VKGRPMFYKAQKRTNYWSKIRKKAPKVPDITCPDIDYVLDKLEKRMGKILTKTQFKLIEKKIERLRKANEQLRESGVYWHDTCKETVRDLLGKKKSR